jgi:hypothetical protein
MQRRIGLRLYRESIGGYRGGVCLKCQCCWMGGVRRHGRWMGGVDCLEVVDDGTSDLEIWRSGSEIRGLGRRRRGRGRAIGIGRGEERASTPHTTNRKALSLFSASKQRHHLALMQRVPNSRSRTANSSSHQAISNPTRLSPTQSRPQVRFSIPRCKTKYTWRKQECVEAETPDYYRIFYP